MNILDHPGSAFSSMGRSVENSLTSTLVLNLTLGDSGASSVARAPAMAFRVASRSLLVPVVVCLLQAEEELYLLFRRMEGGMGLLKAVSDLTTRSLLGRRWRACISRWGHDCKEAVAAEERMTSTSSVSPVGINSTGCWPLFFQ